MKSMKPEDLSKDLQVNLRISPQMHEDFMMNWMNRTEKLRERNRSNTDRSMFRSVSQSESPAFD